MKPVKSLAVILAIMALLGGATSSGQTLSAGANQPRAAIQVPDSFPMVASVQAALDYQAQLVDGVSIAITYRTSPTNQWLWYDGIGIGELFGDGYPGGYAAAPWTNFVQFCTFLKAYVSTALDGAWAARGGTFPTNTAYEYLLDVEGDWDRWRDVEPRLFVASVPFIPVQAADGTWRVPASVTNAITTNAFLSVKSGLVYPNPGGWFYFSLPGATSVAARAMRGGTAAQVPTYVDTIHDGLVAVANQAIGADRLVLTLGFGTNVVQFDERGQRIVGQGPIWLVNFHRDEVYTPPVDQFYVYYDAGATVVVERTTDFATWTPVQVLNDAAYVPGEAIYDSNYDGYGLTASQKAALKTGPQSAGSAAHLFYRARYQ